MLAIKYTLLSFLKVNNTMKHVRIIPDNATAIAYINKQGESRCMHCNSLSVEIWPICTSHNTFISASHIPGNHNVIANAASRRFRVRLLDSKVFCTPCNTFGMPEIDMFATLLNKQLEKDICHGYKTKIYSYRCNVYLMVQ